MVQGVLESTTPFFSLSDLSEGSRTRKRTDEATLVSLPGAECPRRTVHYYDCSFTYTTTLPCTNQNPRMNDEGYDPKRRYPRLEIVLRFSFHKYRVKCTLSTSSLGKFDWKHSGVSRTTDFTLNRRSQGWTFRVRERCTEWRRTIIYLHRVCILLQGLRHVWYWTTRLQK